MPRKIDRAREIDKRLDTAIAGGEGVGPPTPPTVGPAVPSLPAPTGLTVAANVLQFSAVTPLALVSLTWSAPPGVPIASYVVEAATNSTFTTGLVRRTAYSASASLELPTGTLYYFRVAGFTAHASSPYSASASATTATDTTAPGLPTSLAAAFNAAGDLEISWVNPTSANFQSVEVSIYADSGFTTLLYRTYDATQRVLWSASQNRQAGSGTPDPALFVRLASRSQAGVLSAFVSPGTQPVKAVPANVASLTQSWSGDAGTASADLLITWAAASGAAFYRLTLDGVARDVFGTRYVYTFDQNAAEHSGTADAAISISIVGVDGLDQVSGTATTATATNAAPAAPASVTMTGFFTAIGIVVSATLPIDARTLRYRLIQTSPSASDITWDSLSTFQTRELSAAATYQVGVRVVDVFGQTSGETLSSATAIDALTLADLRSEAIYTDSAGTSASGLAVMKDGTLGSGGISYASNAGWVRWVRMRRELTERYRTITLAIAPISGTSTWYIRTSLDGATWSYYSGPVASSRILTSVANEAAAQSAAISSATLGSSSASRVDLPAVVEARYIEVWVRNTGASTRVDEFYPRRLVQSDDIEAESIRAINIAAATITADRLSVAQLSAIAADLGTVTAGTITGATIQTATSGARIELTSANGLRSYDSGGTVQTQIRTSDGALIFGAGAGSLDAGGLEFVSPSGAFTDTASIRWLNGAVNAAQLSEYHTASGHNLLLWANADGSTRYGTVDMRAAGTTGNDTAFFTMEGERTGTAALIELTATDIRLTGANITADAGGINVGSATGAAAGSVRASAGFLPPRSSGTAVFGIDATNQGSGLTIANLATATPFDTANNFAGLVLIRETAVDGSAALFLTAAGAVAEISDPSGHYSNTSGTATSTNFYRSGTTLTLENRRGGSRTYNILAIRIGTTN
jgi:hypothetical protein